MLNLCVNTKKCFLQTGTYPFPRSKSSSFFNFDSSISGKLSFAMATAAGADIMAPVRRCCGLTYRDISE